jgi:hypothetical protein
LHFDFSIHLCWPTCIRLQRYLSQDFARSTCQNYPLSVADKSNVGDRDCQPFEDHRCSNMSDLIDTPHAVPPPSSFTPSHPDQPILNAEKPAKRKGNRRPNYNHIHRNLLPLEIYPLPVLIPHNPLSLLHRADNHYTMATSLQPHRRYTSQMRRQPVDCGRWAFLGKAV